MGAEVRQLVIRGKSLKEAWKLAVEEDTYERGHDFYQGTIRTCSVREVYKRPTEEEELRLDKHEAIAFCRTKPVLNTNKVKSEVKNFPCKETRKWVTYYYGADWRGTPIKGLQAESQTECIKKVRAYVEKNPDMTVEVHIGKKLEKLSTKVAEISYKKSPNEADGEWIVWACVPC